MPSEIVHVCCAILEKNGKIMATRRKTKGPRGGLWEFPGGKVEPGENPEQCIVREIFEELRMQIEIVQQLDYVEHRYPDINIRLIPFVATPKSDIPVLVDHDIAQFFALTELTALEWSAADKKVLSRWMEYSMNQ